VDLWEWQKKTMDTGCLRSVQLATFLLSAFYLFRAARGMLPWSATTPTGTCHPMFCIELITILLIRAWSHRPRPSPAEKTLTKTTDETEPVRHLTLCSSKNWKLFNKSPPKF
jgi:hypothetical protein